MSDSPRSVPDWVVALASRARETDGAPPFSDQAFVDYRLGDRVLVAIEHDAVALVDGAEAEFVVAPDARGRGIGTTLLERLLAEGVTMLWAHGDHPAARALAASHSLRAVRELLHFTGVVSVTPGSATATRPEGNASATATRPEGHASTTATRPEGHASGRVAADEGAGVTETGRDILDTFRVGRDEDEWVALNARTFAFHPDQGSVTKADVEQLETEDWFSADDFLVLRRDGRMIGYCWLKVDDGLGEFYVVGVSPDHQGEHLGSVLFDAGLDRLRALGIRTAQLYVEADNEPALRLYRARGFSQDSIDIQYSSLS